MVKVTGHNKMYIPRSTNNLYYNTPPALRNLIRQQGSCPKDLRHAQLFGNSEASVLSVYIENICARIVSLLLNLIF